MINFSKIANKSLIGKLIRSPLNLIPSNFVLPILQGPNSGFKWIKGSGVNGYWLGSYEVEKQKLIAKYVKERMICYDIGAHVGFYSLMFSRLVGETGKVFSFEPNPLNLFYLLKHLELNKVKNVRVFPFGLWKDNGIFGLTLSSSESYLNRAEEPILRSPVFRIDDLIYQYVLPPDVIKIDAEGAELEVLEGMEKLLRRGSVIVFVALDNKDKREEVYKFLANFGYKIFDLTEKEIDIKEIIDCNEILARI